MTPYHLTLLASLGVFTGFRLTLLFGHFNQQANSILNVTNTYVTRLVMAMKITCSVEPQCQNHRWRVCDGVWKDARFAVNSRHISNLQIDDSTLYVIFIVPPPPPPSSPFRLQQKIDLHILLVPASSWRADLRYADRSAYVESTSAGFVRYLAFSWCACQAALSRCRVEAETTLIDLRAEILNQLEAGSLPQTYIFLRSIGRCLTWVRYNPVSLVTGFESLYQPNEFFLMHASRYTVHVAIEVRAHTPT